MFSCEGKYCHISISVEWNLIIRRMKYQNIQGIWDKSVQFKKNQLHAISKIQKILLPLLLSFLISDWWQFDFSIVSTSHFVLLWCCWRQPLPQCNFLLYKEGKKLFWVRCCAKEFFWGIPSQQNWFSSISCRDHCQRLSIWSSDFLMFLGGIEIKHWPKMSWKKQWLTL